MENMRNYFMLLLCCLIVLSCKKDDELQLAQISTIECHVINSNEAECTGTILNSGTKEIFEKGFCWSVDSNSNIGTDKFEIVNNENDTFSLRINKLLPRTKHYLRAFGTNEIGTFYGNIIMFVTDSNFNGTFIDNRDNKEYKTVFINDEIWMAQNLDYNISGSEYYNADSIMYSQNNGRLYTWDEAMNACPSGWKLPSDNDWMKLEEATGMEADRLTDSGIRGGSANQLLVGGIQDINLTLSGYKWGENWFEYNYSGGYWTSTKDGEAAYCREFQINIMGINRVYASSDLKYSVRCIKNK